MAGRSSVPEADQPLNVKQLQHHAEKLRIAEAAAGLIRDGETIILDSGHHDRGDRPPHPHAGA